MNNVDYVSRLVLFMDRDDLTQNTVGEAQREREKKDIYLGAECVSPEDNADGGGVFDVPPTYAEQLRTLLSNICCCFVERYTEKKISNEFSVN